MLLNDFYTLSEIATEENSLSAKINFNASHSIFEGHFPNQPVVPGVCAIQMVKEIVEENLERKLQLSNAPNVKFLQLITPNISPLIQISWKQENDDWVVNAVIKLEKDMFKMIGNFY